MQRQYQSSKEHLAAWKLAGERFFFQALEVKSTFAPEVAARCNIGHNICMSSSDMVPAEEVLRPDHNADEPQPGSRESRGGSTSEVTRQQLSPSFDGLVATLEDHDYL